MIINVLSAAAALVLDSGGLWGVLSNARSHHGHFLPGQQAQRISAETQPATIPNGFSE